MRLGSAILSAVKRHRRTIPVPALSCRVDLADPTSSCSALSIYEFGRWEAAISGEVLYPPTCIKIGS